MPFATQTGTNDVTSSEPGAVALRVLPLTNAPRQTTSFIGRKGDLARIRAIAETSRLVTLVGEPGIGKTRLAVEFGAAEQDRRVHGVWIVRLGWLVHESLIALAVARVLGVEEDPDRTLDETIVRHLQDKDLLLILDHCDRARRPAAELTARILSQCRGVRVIATCREVLGTASERSYLVSAMSLPPIPAEPESACPAYALFRFESSRLFMDRARSRKPEFDVPLAAISDLCRLCFQLAGNPLAIELAAAPAHVLAIQQLLASLADDPRPSRSPELRAASDSLPLEAAIDWSYGLLSAAEKLVLLRLSVFIGGWTLEDAERVCPDAADSARDDLAAQIRVESVAPIIHSLLSRSLISTVDASGPPKYELLPPVLAFAIEKRQQIPDDNWSRARHAGNSTRAEHGFLSLNKHSRPANGPQAAQMAANYAVAASPTFPHQTNGSAAPAANGAESPSERRQSSHDRASAEALDLLARSAFDRRDYYAALKHLGQSLDLWLKLGDVVRAEATKERMAHLTSSQTSTEYSP